MPADLQPKDIQLLQALADGKKFKQIGEEMGTSEQCAKNRSKRLYVILPAVNGPNAVATALRRGLID
jgi:DNA-binding NarL/FixJ family response regulator